MQILLQILDKQAKYVVVFFDIQKHTIVKNAPIIMEENALLNNNLRNSEILEKAIKMAFSGLNKRSVEILTQRFGLNGQRPKTLEEIGSTHGVTRERIRQIIRESIKKTVKTKNVFLEEFSRRANFTIKAKSGIIEQTKLLFCITENTGKFLNHANFLIKFFTDLQSLEISGEMKKTYALADFDVEEWRKMKNIVRNILESERRLLSHDELKIKLSMRTGSSASVDKFFDFLEVSEEIKKNNFGKWGITSWSEVVPRNTREKAYLILKEKGAPLHFKAIANLIDKYGLNRKKTHTQTVHNELIKDGRFVLVGRGVYALAEWGYRKGTVKEVLEEILRKREQPMKSEEILREVFKMRQIKKSTVMINLKNFFVKNGKNEYSLGRR